MNQLENNHIFDYPLTEDECFSAKQFEEAKPKLDPEITLNPLICGTAGEFTENEPFTNLVNEGILHELEKLDTPKKEKKEHHRTIITQTTEEEERLSAPGKLMEIYNLEERIEKLRKNSKDRKELETNLLQLYKDYNKFVGFKAFNETTISI